MPTKQQKKPFVLAVVYILATHTGYYTMMYTLYAPYSLHHTLEPSVCRMVLQVSTGVMMMRQAALESEPMKVATPTGSCGKSAVRSKTMSLAATSPKRLKGAWKMASQHEIKVNACLTRVAQGKRP